MISRKAEKTDRTVLKEQLTNNGNERLAGIIANYGTTIGTVFKRTIDEQRKRTISGIISNYGTTRRTFL